MRHPCFARITFEMRVRETAGDERLLRFRQRARVPVMRPAVVVFLVTVAAGLGPGVLVARRKPLPRFFCGSRRFGGRSCLLAMTCSEQQERQREPANQS